MNPVKPYSIKSRSSKIADISNKHKRPLRLIYFEACLNKSDAYRRERYLKTGMGKRYLKNRIKGGLTG